MAARSVTARHSHEVVSRLMLSEQWPTAVVSEHTATSVVIPHSILYSTLAPVTQSTSTTDYTTNRGSRSVLLSVPQGIFQYIGNQINVLL